MVEVNRRRARYLLTAVIAVAALMHRQSIAQSTPQPQPGTRHVPGFDLPLSSLLDPAERDFLIANETREAELAKKRSRDYSDCMRRAGKDPKQPEWDRQCAIYMFTRSRLVGLHDRFGVNVSVETIDGVPVEIFEPRTGVEYNRNRVLINLHGGGFGAGARTASQLESAPVAGIGRFRVVSVDYRQAPQASFPAASEDVAAVYKALLRTYRPDNIGIFGCSAGGLLTAQSVAWFDRHKIPLPGAVAISGAGASYYQKGDSAQFIAALEGRAVESPAGNPYLGVRTAKDPLAFPLLSDAIMSRFPPSLFLTATRDPSLSSAVKTHQTLTRLGRETDLHVWEGLGHCFATDGQRSPAAEELWAVTINFFDRTLGK